MEGKKVDDKIDSSSGDEENVIERNIKVRKNFCSMYACDKCPYNTNKKFLRLRYLNQCHKENKWKINGGKADDKNDNDFEDKKLANTMKTKSKREGDGIFSKVTVHRMFACDNCPYLKGRIETKYQILSTAINLGETCCVSTCKTQEEAEKTNYTNLTQQEQHNNENVESETGNDKQNSSIKYERPLAALLEKSNKDSMFGCDKCPYNTNKRILLMRHLNRWHTENKRKSNSDKVDDEYTGNSVNNKLATTIETKSKRNGNNNYIYDNRNTLRPTLAGENYPCKQTAIEAESKTLPSSTDIGKTCCVASTCIAQKEAQKTNHLNLEQQEECNTDIVETKTVNDEKDNNSEDERLLATMLENCNEDMEDLCSKFTCPSTNDKRIIFLQQLNQHHKGHKWISNSEKSGEENDSENDKLAATIKTESKGSSNDIYDDSGTLRPALASDSCPSMQTTTEAVYKALPPVIDVEETCHVPFTGKTQEEAQKTNYTSLEQHEHPISENEKTQTVNDKNYSTFEDERPLTTMLEKSSKDREEFNSLFACDHCPFNTNKISNSNQSHTKNGDKVDNKNNGDSVNNKLATTIKGKGNRNCNDKDLDDNRGIIPLMFGCDNCSYSTTKKHYLRLHMRSHSNRRPYKCKMCVREYKNRGSLQSHNMKIHKAVETHTCKQCKLYHERKQHTQQEWPKCIDNDCVAVVSTLQRHLPCHTVDSLHHQDCTSTAQQDFSFEQRLHLGDDTHKCCEHNSSAKCNDPKLDKRLQGPAEKEVRIFACDLCSAKRTRKAALRRHIKRMHFPKKDLVCNVCGETFCDRYNYMTHKSHCKTRFKCQLCPFLAKKFINLERHMTLHAEKSFKCNDCKQLFRSNSVLVRHQKLHHYESYTASKEKVYLCHICARSFAYERSFLRHQGTHKFD